MLSNLPKTFYNKLRNCSGSDISLTFIITFIVMSVMVLVPFMIFTFANIVAALSLFDKHVQDSLGKYPCEIFVIYKYAFSCGYFSYTLEISTWITIILFAILLWGTVIFVCVGISVILFGSNSDPHS